MVGHFGLIGVGGYGGNPMYAKLRGVHKGSVFVRYGPLQSPLPSGLLNRDLGWCLLLQVADEFGVGGGLLFALRASVRRGPRGADARNEVDLRRQVCILPVSSCFALSCLIPTDQVAPPDNALTV
jgi:hypothetical protein